ncbi:MAG: hypothetical protein Q8L90_18020 [Bacteroidota bacterium]|nr:hypothetical protein [Bacteroidota bacterium]
MSKKELRKELELTLTKSLEEVLSKRNVEVAKKIRKTTYEASKMVAKKFLKNMQPKENKAVTPIRIVKKAIIPLKKVLAISDKKSLTKIKRK